MLGAFALLIISTLPCVGQDDDAISDIRARLIRDALDERGFVARVNQYMTPNLDGSMVYLETIRTDGSWSDVDYQDTDNEWDPLKALDRTLVMAYAYSKEGNSFYKSETMLEAIENALSYWYQVNPVCKNWYKNDLAKQMYLGVIALLVQDEISPKIVHKMIEDQTDKPRMTGSNRTLFATSVFYRGVLEGIRFGFQQECKGYWIKLGSMKRKAFSRTSAFTNTAPTSTTEATAIIFFGRRSGWRRWYREPLMPLRRKSLRF
jgi:chondroitin AC lyase